LEGGGTWTGGLWHNEGIYSGCISWVHAPPPPLATLPNFLWNCIILAYLLKKFEFFFYLKLKYNSLCSPLGFSFYENLTTIKIKQDWQ
jgi:hypothetical protein